jgi:hypothetical protein
MRSGWSALVTLIAQGPCCAHYLARKGRTDQTIKISQKEKEQGTRDQLPTAGWAKFKYQSGPDRIVKISFGPTISFLASKRLSLQLARALRRVCARALRFWCIDPKVILSDILPLFEILRFFPFGYEFCAFCVLDETWSQVRTASLNSSGAVFFSNAAGSLCCPRFREISRMIKDVIIHEISRGGGALG